MMSKMRKSSCGVFVLLFFLLSVGQAQESTPQYRITFSHKSRTEQTTLTRDGRVHLTAKDGGDAL